MARFVAIAVLVALPLGAAADERTRALADHITALETNKVLDDTSRIEAMYDAIMAIADLAPDDAVTPLLERHAKTGYRIPGFRDDDGHRVAIATHDTAAAARFALQQWERQRGRAAAESALKARSPLDFAVGEARLAGYAQAFAGADDATLAFFAAPIVGALEAGADTEPLALMLVERLHDATIAKALLAHGREGIVVHMLPRVAAALPRGEVLPVLVGATRRDAIASVAVAQIGQLATSSRDAHDWLLAAFGEPKLGASAAAALARTGDPIAVAAMADALNGDASVLARSRAALGLKLAGTRAARDALEKFAEVPSAPPKLREQVRDWVR